MKIAFVTAVAAVRTAVCLQAGARVLPLDSLAVGSGSPPDEGEIPTNNHESIKTKTFIIVRHGESTWNEKKLTGGWNLNNPNAGLTAEGVADAERLRRFIADPSAPEFDEIASAFEVI